MKNFQIISVFPTALFHSKMERDFTEDELNFAFKVKVMKNEGNYISKERYILEQDSFKDIKEHILKCVECFVYDTLLYRKDIKPYITQSWLNFTSMNEYHHIHRHYNSFLSGVLYLSANVEHDKIIFHRKNDSSFLIDCQEYNQYNSQTWHLGIQTGDIIIFPSDMTHSVLTKEDDGKRCSIAFNVFLKGNVGDYSNSTELFL